MRKIIITLIFCMAFSTNVFAYTNSYVTKDLSIKADKEIFGSAAPELVIEDCDDFEDYSGNVDFLLILNNAEWLYSGSGTITEGINYDVLTSKELIITIDTDVYNAADSIRIPLYTKLIDSGFATVTIDGRSSPVSNDTFIFAHAGYPDMEIKISASKNETNKFNISISDDYPYQIVAGRIYELKLNNGFNFTGDANVVYADGKFSNKTELLFDKNKSLAYISLKSKSGSGSGIIEISDIGIEPTERSLAGEIEISILAINTSGFSKTIHLGNYNPKEPEINNDSNNTGIRFYIGNDVYYVNGFMYKMDTAPYINKNGYTMLPLRAFANAIGIDDNKISWNDSLKCVNINYNDNNITVPVGGKYIDINGVKQQTDSTAEIEKGRVFLPLRNILNAVGIDNSKIIWNTDNNEIIINL